MSEHTPPARIELALWYCPKCRKIAKRPDPKGTHTQIVPGTGGLLSGGLATAQWTREKCGPMVRGVWRSDVPLGVSVEPEQE